MHVQSHFAKLKGCAIDLKVGVRYPTFWSLGVHMENKLKNKLLFLASESHAQYT